VRVCEPLRYTVLLEKKHGLKKLEKGMEEFVKLKSGS
jgi:hypothetical protein